MAEQTMVFLGIAFRSAKEAYPFQCLVNLFQCLFAEVRYAQQIIASAMQQVVYGENPPFLKTIRRADRQAYLGRAHLQLVGQVLSLRVDLPKFDSGSHGVPPKRFQLGC